jgi:protein SCO1
MKKAVPVLLVVFFLLSVAAVLFVKMKTNTSVSAESIVHAKDKETLKEYFPVPEFALVNQRGQTQTLSSFRNTVWVANFIFTQCKTICPLMTAKMVQLQKKLPTSDIQFVSFSVDPEHDTPEVLNTYANKWAPEEKRWTLFSTDEKQLNQLTQGLRITAQKTPGQIDPIMHSSVFLLIDKNGFVRGMFDSDDRKDFKRLEEAVKSMTAGSPEVPLPENGIELYHALSCANCHEDASLAPALGALVGSKRELETGLLATADDAYVRESILVPQAKRVRGYPLQMPAYDTLTSKQVDALISYISSLKSNNAAVGSAEIASDVVCHMKVRIDSSALKISTDAGVFYFCSQYCLERFTKTPHAFIH